MIKKYKKHRTKAGDEPGKDFRPFFCPKMKWRIIT